MAWYSTSIRFQENVLNRFMYLFLIVVKAGIAWSQFVIKQFLI